MDAAADQTALVRYLADVPQQSASSTPSLTIRLDSLLTLPPEMLLRIVSLLLPQQKLKLRVNRAWAAFINNTPVFWRTIDTRLNVNLLQAIDRGGKRCSRALVKDSESLRILLENCNLRSLYLYSPLPDMQLISRPIPRLIFMHNSKDDARVIYTLFTKFRLSLERLSFCEYEHSTILVTAFPRLRSLTLHTWRDRFHEWFQDPAFMTTLMPELTELKLFPGNSTTWTGFLHHLAKLRWLSIQWPHAVRMGITLPQGLRYLKLNEWSFSLKFQLHLPLLEELDIVVFDLSDLRASFLTDAPPNLRVLHLRWIHITSFWNSLQLGYLCRHPRLANLRVLALTNLRAEPVHLPTAELDGSNLRHVELIDLSRSSVGMEMLLSALEMPGLVRLNVTGCTLPKEMEEVHRKAALQDITVQT